MGKKPLGPQLEKALAEARAFSSQLEMAEREVGKLKHQMGIMAETIETKDQKIETLEKVKELMESHKNQNMELRVENRILKEDRDTLRGMLVGGGQRG